jgi:predicted PurR-regulated permease PerM
MLLAVAVVAGVYVVIHLLPILLILVGSLLLVGTLAPGVEWLEKKGITRRWGIALVFGAMALVSALLTALTLPPLFAQVATLAKNEPALRERVAGVLSRSSLGEPLAQSIRGVRYEAMMKGAGGFLLATSQGAAEIVGGAFSALFLALYIMIDRDRVRGALFAVVPRRRHVRLSRVLVNLEEIVGGYIRGQVLTSAFMAAFVLVLLLACRVPNALALAVFAGLADVLPYIGVVLVIGPAALAALAKGPVIAGIVFVALMAYEELESRFLVPRVCGKALRLPSSLVLFALLVGSALLGIAGALLALPFAATLRMLAEELPVELPGEEGEDPEVQAQDARAQAEYEAAAAGVPALKAASLAVAIAEKPAEQREERDGKVVIARG